MRGQPGHSTRLHARLPHSFLGMDAWMNSKLNVTSFGLQATCVIDVFTLFLDVLLSMGVYTTRHWQTSGQLVQKLNVCTVGMNISDQTLFLF